MRQVKKTIFLAGVLMFALLPGAWAFSLGGPVGNGGDAWQVITIGYGGEKGPKNLGEGYRRNTPVMYYAYDANFLDYFGSNGVAAVDQAFTILNKSFTNSPTGTVNGVDGYSPALTEFPLQSRHVNYRAQALGLIDLKSYVLGAMTGQLGLANPVEYAWTLHNRYHVGTVACPVGMEYQVVQRNFDVVSSPLDQLQYSPYINNTLFTYSINEVCQNRPWLAVTDPTAVDPLASAYLPVASWIDDLTEGITIGHGIYYTGLTRDDMAGLRYLMRATNWNWETPASGSSMYVITTNLDANSVQPFPPTGFTPTNSVSTNGIGFYYYTGDTNGEFGYGSLAPFLAFASTNGPSVLESNYPGVVVSSYTTTNVWTTNIASYSYSYQVPEKSPYGTAPVLTVTTNYTSYWQPYYTYQFANVFTNHIYTNQAELVTTTVGPAVGQPYGSPSVTNTTVTYTNQVGGDFFVLPPFYTNVCPIDVVDASHFNVLAITNNLTLVDTNLINTNTTSTNTTSISESTYLVTYFTNYSYLIAPVTCTVPTNTTGLYQGIEKIQFVRADYDSLLGQYWQPITNNYSMIESVNSQPVVRNFQRIVTQPDFLFNAEDLLSGPSSPPGSLVITRNINFDTANVLSGLAGPGTITSPTTISFTKVGPVFYNSSSDVMDGTPYFNENPGNDVSDFFYDTYYVWGSFDGTTNDPVVYPNGTSIQNLENQVLIQISPASPLPDGSVGVDYYPAPYPVTFTTTGGAFTKPYTWSATGLPPGLNLQSNSDSTATLAGTPTEAGTFNFTLTLTDYVGRSVHWTYAITIQP